MRVEHAIEIERPLDEVWALFDDPSKQPEWLGMEKSLTQVKGKGNEKGAVQSVIFERSSGETELTVTILDRKAPTRLVARYEGMQVPFELTSTFTAIDDDTTEWHCEIDVKLSLLTKALGPVIKGAVSDLAHQMGDDFKAYAESK